MDFYYIMPVETVEDLTPDPSSYITQDGPQTVACWVNKEDYFRSGTWASHPDQVVVELLGTAREGTKAGVVCASFNAG